MPLRVQNILAENLRGLVRLDLPLNGAGVAVLGENGTGKSSLADALEFFFTGSIAHLEGTRGISVERHGHHVRAQPGSMMVELTVNPGSIRLRRTVGEPPVGEGDVQDFLRVGAGVSFILRRSQLLDFVIEEPAQRYSAIARLLGLEFLNDRELVVKGVRDSLQGVAETTRQALADLEREIRVVCDVNLSSTESDLLSRINEIRARNGLSACAALEQLSEMSASTPAVVPAVTTATAERVSTARGLIPAPEITQTLIKRVGTLRARTAELAADLTDREYALVSFLRDGVAFLENDADELCPLCGQSVNRTELIRTLRDRIAQTVLLSDRASILRVDAAAIGEEIANQCTNLQRAVELLTGIEDFDGVPSDLTTVVGRVLKFRPGLNRQPLPQIGTPEERLDDLLQTLATRNVLLLVGCEQWLERSRVRAIQGAQEVLRIGELAQRLAHARSENLRATASLDVAVKLFDHLTSARKEIVRTIYAEIRDDLMRFYGMLHPGEDPESISLELDDRRRASAVLLMTSFGRSGVDPRAYASEAHLDTLGLCIFLAFAHRFQSEFPLLVLDDVLTTVDGQHRLRVAELLRTEFFSKQLVITTHDRAWFRELQEQFRSRGGAIRFVEFERWSLESGPSLRDYKPPWEDLEESFTDGTALPLVANACRQYLEWITRKICSTTGAPLPFTKDGHYELGELFTGARTRLQDLLRDDGPKQRFETAFEGVSRTVFMGNVLSHINPISDSFTRAELEELANAVHRLELAFSCDTNDHHALLVYSRETRELSCPSTTCTNRTRFATV